MKNLSKKLSLLGMMFAGAMTAVALNDGWLQMRHTVRELRAAYVGLPCTTKAHACTLKVTLHNVPHRVTQLLRAA